MQMEMSMRANGKTANATATAPTLTSMELNTRANGTKINRVARATKSGQMGLRIKGPTCWARETEKDS